MANAPSTDSTRLKNARSVLALAAFLAVIPDSAGDRTVKLPTTSQKISSFAGFPQRASAAGADCSLVCLEGDTAIAIASGTVTRGDRVYIDTASGNEGQVKKYTSFGVDGAQLIVGVAETTASDTEQVEVRIQLISVGDGFQAGVATLAAGTVTVASVALTATSRILVSRKTAGGTAGTGGLYAPSGSRDTGASTFAIISADTSGALVNTDTSVVDWVVLG